MSEEQIFPPTFGPAITIKATPPAPPVKKKTNVALLDLPGGPHILTCDRDCYWHELTSHAGCKQDNEHWMPPTPDLFPTYFCTYDCSRSSLRPAISVHACSITDANDTHQAVIIHSHTDPTPKSTHIAIIEWTKAWDFYCDDGYIAYKDDNTATIITTEPTPKKIIDEKKIITNVPCFAVKNHDKIHSERAEAIKQYNDSPTTRIRTPLKQAYSCSSALKATAVAGMRCAAAFNRLDHFYETHIRLSWKYPASKNKVQEFKTFLFGITMDLAIGLYKKENPNRRPPGSDRTKRLRKKRFTRLTKNLITSNSKK